MAIEAAELMVRVGADTSAAERGLKSMGTTVQNAGRAMTTTGLAMTAGITAPLLGIAAAALNSAADFEQSMNVLQQVTGASTGTMNEMTNAALKLGAETSFSAGEAADAMLELAKAGMETDEVLASISGVMDLAAAGGIALADAANITANALNAFHLEASEADRVANLLAGGANNSSAEISDLAAGIAQAGFAFANAGQPIEYLVASLMTLTDVGLTGSDAGTALKNAFMRLANPTKEARAVMSELNLEFYDATGNMKMLPDIITMLNEAFVGMTNEQRDAALTTLFLSDGMKAMIPLLDDAASGMNENVAAISAQGQSSAVAGARMKGLRGAIEYLKGSIDSFLIGAARPFLDMIGNFIRQGADWLTALGELPPAVTNAALAFAAVLAVAGPVALAIGGVISAFAALNPIVLAVTAAVALLAAAWSADFMGIQGVVQSVWDTVTGFFTEVTALVQTVSDAISNAFANTTFPTLAELWADFTAGEWGALVEKITTTAITLMANLETELQLMAVDFAGAAQKWANDFLAVLYTEAPNLINVAKTWGTLLRNDLQATLMDFGPWATKVVNDMTAKQKEADYGPAGTAAADATVNAIGTAFAAMETAGETFNAIYTWSNQMGLDMRAAIIAGLQSGGILSAINNYMTELDRDVTEFITNYMTRLQTLAGEWVLSLPELAIPKPAWMDQFFADAAAWSDNTKKALDVWLSAAEAWIRAVDGTLGNWLTAADTWASNVKTNFDAWVASAEAWVTSLNNAFLGFLLAADAWLISLGMTFTTWVTDANSWLALVTQSLSAWLAGVNIWIGSVATTLTGWINSAQSWILNVGATLTSWLNRAISWVASLLTAPPWVSDLLAFAANVPTWVSNFMDFTPSWLDDLLGFTIEIPDTTAPAGEDAVPPSTIGMVSAAGTSFSRPSTSQPYYAPAGAATVTIGAVHIHNDMDVEVLASTIARRISQGGRR